MGELIPRLVECFSSFILLHALVNNSSLRHIQCSWDLVWSACRISFAIWHQCWFSSLHVATKEAVMWPTANKSTNQSINQSILIPTALFIDLLAPIQWRMNVVFPFEKPTFSLNWLSMTISPPESLGPFLKHLIWPLLSRRSMWTQRAAEKMIWWSEQFNSFFSATLYSAASIVHQQSRTQLNIISKHIEGRVWINAMYLLVPDTAAWA